MDLCQKEILCVKFMIGLWIELLCFNVCWFNVGFFKKSNVSSECFCWSIWLNAMKHEHSWNFLKILDMFLDMFYVYLKTSLKIKVHWGHTWRVSLKCQSLTRHAKDFGGLEFLRLYCMYLVSQLSIQKEEAKKKEVHVEENVPAPSPRSNCSVMHLLVAVIDFVELAFLLLFTC